MSGREAPADHAAVPSAAPGVRDESQHEHGHRCHDRQRQ